jgi:SAM-dependent methyltransferase
VISNELILGALDALLRRRFTDRGGQLLDVGAGTRPYAPLYEPLFDRCLSTDVEFSPHDVSSVDAIAPADQLPFDNGAFDCLICTEVLEHTVDPVAALGEFARVLAPGGVAFISTPFLRPMHEEPHDYHRFTPWGLRAIAEGSGLIVEQIAARGDYIAVALMTALWPIGKAIDAAPRGTRFARVLQRLLLELPQRVYLRYWRWLGHSGKGSTGRLRRQLSRYSLGYTVELTKPDA